MEVTPGWLLSALAAVAGAAIVGLVVVPERRLRQKTFLVRDHGRRRRRRGAGGALVRGRGDAAAGGRALAAARDAGDAARSSANTTRISLRVRAILATRRGAEPGANLALLGDKRFLFSDSGESFLMFGVRGRSWIALGAAGRPPRRADGAALAVSRAGRRPRRAARLLRPRPRRPARRGRAGLLDPEDRRVAPPCRWTASRWRAAGAETCAATGARPARRARLRGAGRRRRRPP